MKVYVSGPMSGIEDMNFPAFNTAAEHLRAAGHEVANPADLGVRDGWEWADYLKADLALLLTCDAILLLPGWEGSKGARLERRVAVELGLQTVHPSTVMPCRYDPNGGDDGPSAYCVTHAGWVLGGDECEGAIGSIHCNACVNTGCKGAARCGCHNPADVRYEGAFA